MKKFLFSFIFFVFMLFMPFALSAKADIYAPSSKNINYYGIGVINLKGNFVIYEHPDKNSKILREKKKSKSAIINSNHLSKTSYLAYIPSENIALLAVEDNTENGWYQVYINQETGETGWVHADSGNSFFTYKSLFYKYGKKYGIMMFKDLSADKKVLYSKQSTDSQKLEELTYPKYVNFTVIRGNWMLVSVNDTTKQAKVGWFEWRNEDGSLNAFPYFKEQS